MLGRQKHGMFILIWVTIFCCLQASQVESLPSWWKKIIPSESENSEEEDTTSTTGVTIPTTPTTTIAPTAKTTSTAATTLSYPIIPSPSPPIYAASSWDSGEEVKTEKPKKTSTAKTSTVKTATTRRSRSRSRSSTITETPAANFDSGNSDYVDALITDDSDKYTSEENREMIRKYKEDEEVDEGDGDSAPINKKSKINYSSSPSSTSETETISIPDASAPTYTSSQVTNPHLPSEKQLEEQYIDRHQKNIYSLYHETEFDIYILTHTTLLKAQQVIHDINRDLSRLLGEECRDQMDWFKPMPPPPSENDVIPNNHGTSTNPTTPSGTGTGTGQQNPGCEASKDCRAIQYSLDLQILSLEKLILENKKFREESIDYRKRSLNFHALYSQSLTNTFGNYTATKREIQTFSSYLPVGDEPVGVVRGDDASSSNDNFEASQKDKFRNTIGDEDTSQLPYPNPNKKSKINYDNLDDDTAPATTKKPKSKNTPSVNSDEFTQRYPPASSRSRKEKSDQSKTKTESRSGSSRKIEFEDEDENEIDPEIKTTTTKTVSTTPTVDAVTTKAGKISLTTTTAPANTTTTDPAVTVPSEAKVSKISKKAADEATKSPEPLASSLLIEHLNTIDQISDGPKRIQKYQEFISATIKAGFSFNSDIFQVASHVKNTPNLSLELTADLKQSFPIPVQIVVWGDESKLKMKSEVSMFKLYANQDNELKTQKLKHNRGHGHEREANLDGDAWIFLPLPLPKNNDGDVFALLNVRSKSAVTVIQREDEINHHGRPKIVLENVTGRNISMLPGSFGWKLSLICDYAATERNAKIMEENGKALSQIPVLHEHGARVVPVSEITFFDKNGGHCPKGAWLVTMDNVGKRDFSLDVHQTGTVYLGDAGNGGRFQLHT